MPNWDYEREITSRGYASVAGIDEVGRGTIAGPVVAAAIILPEDLEGDAISLIRDSKQLSIKQRETAKEYLDEVAISTGIGAASHFEIDDIGIVGATRRAMARAVESLDTRPDHLLIDAIELPELSIDQTSIIKGDSKSRSVAAASIVAKVTRDRLMTDVFDSKYPGYGFAEHKGYCTNVHVEALNRMGPCLIHRMTFQPVRSMLKLLEA